MMLIDLTRAVGLSSSSSIAFCRPIWSSDDVIRVNVAIPWKKIKRLRKKIDNSVNRRNGSMKNMIQACGKFLGSGSDKVGDNGKSNFHPFEDILESEAIGAGEGQLNAAEITRTIVEVNNKATLLFSGLVNDEVHENIFWPDLPYLTDEHGNVYVQVNNDEDIMQTLTSDDNHVQVIIGLDTRDMLSEMELSGSSEIDFGIDEIGDEDGEFDDDDDDDDDDDEDEDDEDGDFGDGEWVDMFAEDDQGDSDGSLGDWAKLETMRSAHPMHFAKKIVEVVSDDPIDFMEQPPEGLAIQGLLRPAFIEEHPVMNKHKESLSDQKTDLDNAEKGVKDKVEDSALTGGKDKGLANGTSFYKLEIIKIQLISAYGHQIDVEIGDYRKALPDAIAHSASKIISRVNATGEKTATALKTLCWRCKGLQVEETSLIGIDSLGFDLRVCSGTQVQTLRFAFNSQATSEYSAERQLNDILFPKSNQKTPEVKQARRKET